jgi:hypothetical protein
MEARRFARLGFYTKSSAKRPKGARTVQRLRSDVDLRRLVRGTSSQLRGGRFHGHCTSASAMKQWTWTHAIKKQTEESEKKGRPATRLALLPLHAGRCGTPGRRNSLCTMEFRLVWQSDFDAPLSMSRREGMAARTSHRTSSRPASSATQRGTSRSIPWKRPNTLLSCAPGWQRAGGTRRRSRPLSRKMLHRPDPVRLYKHTDCEIKSKSTSTCECIAQYIARSIVMGLFRQSVGGNPWKCAN